MARRRNATTMDDTAATTSVVPLRRAPILLARHFLQICREAAEQALAREGLKSGQFAVLVSLSPVTGEPGIDQNGLALRLGFDRGRVSQLVDELEAAGLIDRRINGADRRARLLQLTPRGEQLRARLQPSHNAQQTRVLAALAPDEQELLLNLLLRVIRSNRAAPGAARPKRRPSSAGKRRLSSIAGN